MVNKKEVPEIMSFPGKRVSSSLSFDRVSGLLYLYGGNPLISGAVGGML